jgi:hypothetical protein
MVRYGVMWCTVMLCYVVVWCTVMMRYVVVVVQLRCDIVQCGVRAEISLLSVML